MSKQFKIPARAFSKLRLGLSAGQSFIDIDGVGAVTNSVARVEGTRTHTFLAFLQFASHD